MELTDCTTQGQDILYSENHIQSQVTTKLPDTTCSRWKGQLTHWIWLKYLNCVVTFFWSYVVLIMLNKRMCCTQKLLCNDRFYYPFKKYVESDGFFFQFAVQARCHLSPCLNDHSYSWVVNLLQLVFKQAGSKQKCQKWMS